MSRSAIFDRIRIIPRPDDFLDRNVGSSGEIFFDKQANTLRLYNGKATGGFSILTAGNFTQQIANTGVAVLEKTVTVGVDSVAGQATGVFYIDGVEKPILQFVRGYTYVFDQSDASNASYGGLWHPLMFSTTQDGDLVPGGLHYDQTTTDHGIVYLLDDDPVTMRYYTDNFKTATTKKILITVQSNAPDTLWYWCHFHTGQGNQINISDPGTGTGSGSSSIEVSDTVPSTPSAGNIWFNSTSGKLYVYVNDGDSSQWVQPASSTVGDYTLLSNKPTIPTSITDLGITDGTTGQVLSTDGAGAFSFTTVATAGIIGSFTFTGTNIDTDDSSGITVTPPLTANSDLTVQNDLNVVNDVFAKNFISTGTGSPEFDSASKITLTAPDGVFINSFPTPYKMGVLNQATPSWSGGGASGLTDNGGGDITISFTSALGATVDDFQVLATVQDNCLLYTSPSPRD